MDDLHDGTASVELGCGSNGKLPIGLDFFDHGQEIVWDLHEGIPLPDNSCAKIYSSHTFEHIRPEALITLFNACWRVLSNGGELHIVVPSIENEKAFIPGHLSYWKKSMFEFFTGNISASFDPAHFNHQSGAEVVRLWSIIDLVENDRHNIHCKLTPANK